MYHHLRYLGFWFGCCRQAFLVHLPREASIDYRTFSNKTWAFKIMHKVYQEFESAQDERYGWSCSNVLSCNELQALGQALGAARRRLSTRPFVSRERGSTWMGSLEATSRQLGYSWFAAAYASMTS